MFISNIDKAAPMHTKMNLTVLESSFPNTLGSPKAPVYGM